MERTTFDQLKQAIRQNNTQLPVTVRVYGRVRYSHICTKVDGEELKKKIERDKADGRIPEEKPHYNLLLDSNVTVQAEPGTLPQIISYVQGKISQKGIFGAISKSPYPPAFAVGQGLDPVMVPGEEEGTEVVAENTEMLPGELAKGLLVCAGIKVYRIGNYIGIGLDYVVALEKPAFLQGGNTNMNEALAKIGVVDPNMFPKQQEPPQGTDTPPQAVNPMAGAGQMTGAAAPAYQGTYQGQYGAVPQAAGYGAGTMAGATQPGSGPFMNPPEGDPAYYTQPQGNGAAAPQPGINYYRN